MRRTLPLGSVHRGCVRVPGAPRCQLWLSRSGRLLYSGYPPGRSPVAVVIAPIEKGEEY